MLFVTTRPRVHVGLRRTYDHQRAVDAEADIHERATDRALAENESQSAQTGQAGSEHVHAAGPAMERRKVTPHAADQLNRSKKKQHAASDEVRAYRFDWRGLSTVA